MPMWRKTSNDEPINASEVAHVEPSVSDPAENSLGQETPATIGTTIKISGDISGDENLIVHGEVEGSITLVQNNVTVGKDGQVKANVHARIIDIGGKVDGDLQGTEQVIIRKYGDIRGNVIAPRVTLEDGCRFKGSIDMETSAAVSSSAEKIAGMKSHSQSRPVGSTTSTAQTTNKAAS